MGIARNPRLRPLKALAQAVGAKITVGYDRIGEGVYILIDKDGEPVAHEADTYDMLDCIAELYGGHEAYRDALEEYHLAVR